MTFTLVLLQVFHSLLKAHAVEARAVVRQALEILTPAMPGRMEDGNVSLCRSVAYSSRFYRGLSVIILLLYTVSHKKTCHFYFCDNFGKCRPILKILSVLHIWRFIEKFFLKFATCYSGKISSLTSNNENGSTRSCIKQMFLSGYTLRQLKWVSLVKFAFLCRVFVVLVVLLFVLLYWSLSVKSVSVLWSAPGRQKRVE